MATTFTISCYLHFTLWSSLGNHKPYCTSLWLMNMHTDADLYVVYEHLKHTFYFLLFINAPPNCLSATIFTISCSNWHLTFYVVHEYLHEAHILLLFINTKIHLTTTTFTISSYLHFTLWSSLGNHKSYCTSLWLMNMQADAGLGSCDSDTTRYVKYNY